MRKILGRITTLLLVMVLLAGTVPLVGLVAPDEGVDLGTIVAEPVAEERDPFGGYTLTDDEKAVIATQGAKKKINTIATTDGEHDDMASMVRYLTMANEFNIKGLILTSSNAGHHTGGTIYYEPGATIMTPSSLESSYRTGQTLHEDGSVASRTYSQRRWTGFTWIPLYLSKYEEVYPNLIAHDPTYPTPAYLKSVFKYGNIKVVGEMDEITEGSEWIKKCILENPDGEPLLIQHWGDANTTARALRSIKEEYEGTPQWDRILQKIHSEVTLYMILERQANTYTGYIRSEWPGIRAIMNNDLFFGFYQTGWDTNARHSTATRDTWFRKPWGDTILNIGSALTSESLMRVPWSHANSAITNPSNKFYTPPGYSYVPNGPHSAADNFPYSTWGDGSNTQNTGTFQAEGDTPSYLFAVDNGLRSYEDPAWGGWAGRFGRNTSYPSEYRDNVDDIAPSDSTVTARNWTFSRWIPDIQGTYSVYANWSVTPDYEEANHRPVSAVMNGLDLNVLPGQTINLDGVAYDPDGDTLSYRWWRYADVDTASGTGTIEVGNTADVTYTVPSTATPGQTIHLILEVSDAPSTTTYTTLRNYKRVVLTVVDDLTVTYINFNNSLPAAGVQLSVNGEAAAALPSRLSVKIGEPVTLKVTTNDPAGYEFVGWSGDVTSANAEITVTPQDNTQMNLTVTFKEIYEYANIAVSQIGGNNSDVQVSVNDAAPQALGTIRLKVGQEYTLKAVTNANADFVSWSGGITSASDEITFTLTGNMSLIINVKSSTVTVQFNVAGIPRNGVTTDATNSKDVMISVNGATATKMPTSGNYSAQLSTKTTNTITVTVANTVDYSFSHWSGGISSTDYPLVFTPGESRMVTANFTSNGFTNIATASAGASVLVLNQVNTTWAAANLINGNIVAVSSSNLGWSTSSLGSTTPATPPWFAINLGSSKTFDRFHIYPRMEVYAPSGTTSCNFPIEFLLEYANGDFSYSTGVTTTANTNLLNALTWTTIPGGTGTNGRFVIPTADIPIMKPYVIQLNAPITARYVRMTVYRTNDRASNDSSTYYLQLRAFGIYKTTNTVSFDSNGGSEIASIEVQKGQLVAEPKTELFGYSVSGWYLNGELYDFSTPVTEDITLVAQWSRNPITSVKITNSQGAVAAAAITVVRNSTVQFYYSVNADAIPEGIVWKISPTGYAKVDEETGLVTVSNKTGTVVLMATDTVNGATASIVLRIV